MADPRTPDVFADLLSAALVGTDRRPLRTATMAGPLGTALAALPADDPAGALLDAAALATVYRRAGARPTADVPLPPPAPAETHPEVPAHAAQRLSTLLDGETSAVLVEWLELAGERGLRVPARLVPRLLDRARMETALRMPMLSVGGQRMRWLAAQNPDWHYLSRVGGVAESLADADWEFGDDGRRLDHLRALRAVDPAVARAKLAADWASEEPRQRAALLATFEVGASPADEEFLEAALDDRRKEVRQAAAAVLVRLPASAYAGRMAERAAACLTFEGRKLLVTLPAEPDAAARRDGIGAGRQQPFEATEALEEILNATPLAAFRALRPTLTDMLDASRGDHQWRLVTALSLAVSRESDLDAAHELLSWRGAAKYDGLPDWLLPMLADADRFRLVAERLDRRSIGDERTYQLVSGCPRPWSVDLGTAALAALRKHFSRLGYRVHRWAALLGERLPVELLPDAIRLADAFAADDTSNGLARLGELAALRQQMHKEFS